MRHSHYFQWLSLPLLSVAVTQQLYAQPNESLPTVELEPVVITIDKSGMALANRIAKMVMSLHDLMSTIAPQEGHLMLTVNASLLSLPKLISKTAKA